MIEYNAKTILVGIIIIGLFVLIALVVIRILWVGDPTALVEMLGSLTKLLFDIIVLVYTKT